MQVRVSDDELFRVSDDGKSQPPWLASWLREKVAIYCKRWLLRTIRRAKNRNRNRKMSFVRHDHLKTRVIS